MKNNLKAVPKANNDMWPYLDISLLYFEKLSFSSSIIVVQCRH